MHDLQGIYYYRWDIAKEIYTTQSGDRSFRKAGGGEHPPQKNKNASQNLEKDIRKLILCWSTEMTMDPHNIINTNSLGQKSHYRIKALLFSQLISLESILKQLCFQCTSCTEGKFMWWNGEDCNPCSVPFNSSFSNDMRNPGGKICSACLAMWQRGKCNWLFLLRKLVLPEVSSLFSFILKMKYAV